MTINCELLLGNIAEAIFMLDQDGYINYCNPTVTSMTGYLPEELINEHFAMLYPTPEDKVKTEYELSVASKQGKLLTEGWKRNKNGRNFWGELMINPIVTEYSAWSYICILRDNTQRKEKELQLRESEERYRLMIEGVRDYAIFMLDAKGYIMTWNDGARRINGYTGNEIIGKHFSTFYTSDDLESKKPERELAIATETGKYEEEGWRVRKDGSRFWANVVITAVYNNDGTLFGYSKVTRDLTERKESEKALRDSYEQYRRLAHELKTTNKELSLANQDLEQFTSIVSHDLQEPIRTLKSFLQLIDINISNKKYGDLPVYSGKAINAANRMKELINNLLHYSQIGKRQIVFADVDVKELLNQATQNLKTAIDNSKAQLVIDNRVEQVKGDKTQLLQLFQNLLGNAIKFTDVHQPRIALKCYKVNDYIQCEVADNGIGIAKEDTTKVFEIFKRLNTKKEFPGTGIGLSICKKIVDQHGGRIWLESETGKGTTFYFTLNEKMVAE